MEMYSGSCALIGMVRVKWKKERVWEQREGVTMMGSAV